jgi:hypothetical protein
VKLTPEEIEALLEEDNQFDDRRSKRWFGTLGPFRFRLTEFQRTRLPIVGVAGVTGTRVSFEVKGRNKGNVLLRMANWVSSLNPDRLQGLVDFLVRARGPSCGQVRLGTPGLREQRRLTPESFQPSELLEDDLLPVQVSGEPKIP